MTLPFRRLHDIQSLPARSLFAQSAALFSPFTVALDRLITGIHQRVLFLLEAPNFPTSAPGRFAALPHRLRMIACTSRH